MQLPDCNPFIRTALIQPAILERTGLRKAYDHRLFYILQDGGHILIEDQKHPIGMDTIILLPPCTAYDFQGQLKVAVLNFDMTRSCCHKSQPIFPPRAEAFDPSLLLDTQLVEGFDHPLVLHTNGNLQSLLLQIVFHANSPGSYATAKSSALLKLLLTELSATNADTKNQHVEKALTYIRMHAPSLHSNADAAHALGYHPVYLNDLLRRATGKTLHNTILDAKLQIACQYLVRSEESIESIACLTGFCSRTHFCTLFKKILGHSPAQYRKLHKKNA